MAWRALKGDEKFALVRVFALALAALGGTSFSGANLQGALFTQASLKSTNFAASRQGATHLHRVRWKGAQKLDRARLGEAILQNPTVRELLVSHNGAGQNFTDCNLRGANLAGANLVGANFKRAILSEATLAEAQLQGANLTEAQCIGTNFTKAHLTGTCLEAWNIDSTTVLEQVDCQYVFLLETENDQGDRERRPHHPDKTFQPGDFEKFFKEVLDDVKILIRNGVNPEAFRAAFQKIMETNPAITRDAIKAIEKQEEDVLLTLQVPQGTNKGQLEGTWDEAYAARLEAVRAAAMLEGEKRRADDLKEIQLTTVTSIGNFLSNFTISTSAMSNSNNPTITTGDGSFVATGDVSLTGSTINLGEISGQVTNQINQLPDVSEIPGQPSLKDLLRQLQTAIETASELSHADKADALAEVAELAKAGQTPLESAMQKLAKRSMNALKGMASGLSDTATLATALKTLLPLIAGIFSL